MMELGIRTRSIFDAVNEECHDAIVRQRVVVQAPQIDQVTSHGEK